MASPPAPARTLELPTPLLRRLERMRFGRLRGAGHGLAATRAGAVRMGRAGFLEHRAYVPGDDLRDLDWHAYARTGAPHVKVHGVDRARRRRIAGDLSASMAVGGKDDAACLLALAVAYAGLAVGDTVRIDLLPTLPAFPSEAEGRGGAAPSSPPTSPRASPRDIAAEWPGWQRGMAAWPSWRSRLAHAPSGGRIDWKSWGRRSGRTGRNDEREASGASSERLFVISDFCDEAAWPALARAADDARRPLALALVADDEARRVFDTAAGAAVLVDSETGEERRMTLDPRRRDAQAAHREAVWLRHAEWAARRRARWIVCRIDGPALSWLARATEGLGTF